MCDASTTAGAIRVKRWAIIALLTIALTLLAGGLFVASWWGLGRIPAWFFWQAGLVFLLAAEFIYGMVVVLIALALVVLSVLLIRGRDRRLPEPWGTAAARGLLLCAALSIGLVAAEVVGAIWQARAHRQTAVPIGGFGRGAETEDSAGPPIAAADVTLPTRFSESSNDRSLDVVVLGESSAEGVPYNGWLSIGAIVSWRSASCFRAPRPVAALGPDGRHPRGPASEARRAREAPGPTDRLLRPQRVCLSLSPPHVIDHYVDSCRRTAWGTMVEWAERTSSFCGLIQETADKCRLAIPTPPGRGSLVDVPAYTPGEFRGLLADFHRRLETIASYAERIGAVLVLIVPPSNDADFEPNRSFLPASTSRVEREEFARAFRAARRTEMTNPALARAMYQRLLVQQPGFAETHYRLARLLEGAGTGTTHMVTSPRPATWTATPFAARDHSRTLTGRSQSGTPVSWSTGRPCSARSAVTACWIAACSMTRCIPPSGDICAGQAVLAALQARGAWAWPASRPAPVIDPSQCAAHFGMQPTSWKYVCAIGATTYVKMCRWTHDASERLGKAAVYDAARGHIERGAVPESLGLPNVGIPEPVPALRPTALPDRGPDSGPGTT